MYWRIIYMNMICKSPWMYKSYHFSPIYRCPITILKNYSHKERVTYLFLFRDVFELFVNEAFVDAGRRVTTLTEWWGGGVAPPGVCQGRTRRHGLRPSNTWTHDRPKLRECLCCYIRIWQTRTYMYKILNAKNLN